LDKALSHQLSLLISHKRANTSFFGMLALSSPAVLLTSTKNERKLNENSFFSHIIFQSYSKLHNLESMRRPVAELKAGYLFSLWLLSSVISSLLSL